jgi:hypothetical protein
MVWTRLVAAAALAACGATAAPVPAPTPPQAPRRPLKRGPIARVMVPAELGDPGAMERIPWAARLAKAGSLYLTIGGPAIEVAGEVYSYDVWPVIAEAGGLVELVMAGTTVRLALWAQRGDLVTVAAEDTAVSARPEAVPDPVHRATIVAGAAVVRGSADDAGWVEVYLDDADVAVRGWLPAASVGEVYRVGPAIERRDEFSLRPDTAIRARPAADGAVLATTVRQINAIGHHGAPAGWREVTAYTDNVVIRGFVPAAAIDPTFALSHGEGHGSGYGVSHARYVKVPAGTCLFAGQDAEVVGVQIETSEHLLDSIGAPGWWKIWLPTGLASFELWIHDPEQAIDLSRTKFESCTDPASTP